MARRATGDRMNTPQEYWDACLIMAWRNFETYGQLCQKFKDIVGFYPSEHDPKLLRVAEYLPPGVQARMFIASQLPKINDRLFNQEPDKDVLLLRALSKSKYDVQKPSREHFASQQVGRDVRKNELRITFELQDIAKKKHQRDGDVVKPSRDRQIRRRR
jgi:hypothetical protein